MPGIVMSMRMSSSLVCLGNFKRYGFDRLEQFEAHLWFDFVVPVDVFVYASELVLFLFVDAVDAFQSR